MHANLSYVFDSTSSTAIMGLGNHHFPHGSANTSQELSISSGGRREGGGGTLVGGKQKPDTGLVSSTLPWFRFAKAEFRSPASDELLVYMYPHSYHSQVVAMALYEKSIPFTAQILDIQKGDQFHAEYLKVNPRGEVPVLNDGISDTVVSDTFQILRHLESNVMNGTGPSLLPDVPSQLYQAENIAQKLYRLKVDSLTFGSVIYDLDLEPKGPYESEQNRESMRYFIDKRRAILRTQARNFPQYAEHLTKKLKDLEHDWHFLESLEDYEDLIRSFEQELDECEGELQRRHAKYERKRKHRERYSAGNESPAGSSTRGHRRKSEKSGNINSRRHSEKPRRHSEKLRRYSRHNSERPSASAGNGKQNVIHVHQGSSSRHSIIYQGSAVGGGLAVHRTSAESETSNVGVGGGADHRRKSAKKGSFRHDDSTGGHNHNNSNQDNSNRSSIAHGHTNSPDISNHEHEGNFMYNSHAHRRSTDSHSSPSHTHIHNHINSRARGSFNSSRPVDHHPKWWLCSPDISMADLFLAMLLWRIYELGFYKRLIAPRPNLVAYFKRMQELPSFRKATNQLVENDDSLHHEYKSSGIEDFPWWLVLIPMGTVAAFSLWGWLEGSSGHGGGSSVPHPGLSKAHDSVGAQISVAAIATQSSQLMSHHSSKCVLRK